VIVVTNEAVYNIHKKEVKRMIPISEISGVSKTTASNKEMEFAIHVPKTYDYRFVTQKRDDIIHVLKQLYIIKNKDNMPVYHINEKTLKNFVTTETDFKKGTSKIPTMEYRSYDEDLLMSQAPPTL
jgi:hypothetical protein